MKILMLFIYAVLALYAMFYLHSLSDYSWWGFPTMLIILIINVVLFLYLTKDIWEDIKK